MNSYREMFYTLNVEVTKAIKLLQNAQSEMARIYNENSDTNNIEETILSKEEKYSKKLRIVKPKYKKKSTL